MYGDTSNLYSYFRPTPDRKRILLGSGFDKIEVTDRSELSKAKTMFNISRAF